MAGYLGAIPVPQATQNRESFTASADQTSFATAGYTVGFVDTFLNGVRLNTADFTATNGSDIVLAANAAVNDILDVISYATFEVNAQTFTGTTTLTDVVAASLDISGNIDIDGITNLDVVDIDGAVNMATTALVTGVLTTTAATVFNGGFAANQESSITAADGQADNAYLLQLKNEEATNDRSWGVLINAGSTATDAPLVINTHDSGTALLQVAGSGQVRFVDGTASLPAISNLGDLNTGILFPAADTIALSTAGTERLRVDAAGQTHTTTGIAGANSHMATGYVADAGVVYSRGLVSAGARSNNNGYLAGLAIVNGDNAQNGAGAANGRILANIGGMVVTDDSNAGDDSGGDMTFWTKPNGGNLAERMRINSLGAVTINAGNLALDDGNLVVASGHGIDFSASGNSGGMASELLDDYEKGTWTPALASGFSGAPSSYSTQRGGYTKVGNVVTAQFEMNPNGATASASLLQIGGLPFNSIASSSGYGGGFITYQVSFVTADNVIIHVPAGNTTISFYLPTGNALNGNASGVDINQQIIATVVYLTA
jgi:hypothetical protein